MKSSTSRPIWTRYLIPSLSLSDENKGIGRDDGEAEVDEDDGALRPDVPVAEIDQLEGRTRMNMAAVCDPQTSLSHSCQQVLGGGASPMHIL